MVDQQTCITNETDFFMVETVQMEKSTSLGGPIIVIIYCVCYNFPLEKIKPRGVANIMSFAGINL